jgi:hypothetical protein
MAYTRQEAGVRTIASGEGMKDSHKAVQHAHHTINH